LEELRHAHQHLVDDAAVIAGERANRDADENRQYGRNRTDGERRSPAADDARENVATEMIGAERDFPI
jgi:hypothetical protein